jgi:hypothetical protein
MRHHVPLAVGFTAVLLLTVAACGDSSSGPSATPSEYQTIDEFMGRADAQAEEEAYVALRSEIETRIVDCMAGHGLEYVPRPADPGRPVLGEGMSDAEFGRTYGYGIFTGVLDEARWIAEHGDDEGQDPDTMWGDFTDDVESYMVLVDQCNEQAEVELGRPEPGLREALSVSVEEAWRPLEGALDDLERDIETDDRLVAAWDEWSACLDEKGYSFESEENIESYLMGKLEGLGESLTEGTLLLDEAMERDLQPLADEEIAIATADLACRTDVERIRVELQREYGGLFIDQHREELEAIRDLEQQFAAILLEGWQW